jgi:hypothetical protein
MRINAPNAVVGLCVMGLGIALVLDRMGLIRAELVLQYWPVGLVLLGAAMVLQALRGSPDGVPRGQFPVGALIWLVVLGMLFTHVFARRSAAPAEEGRLRLFAVMGGDKRDVDAPFRGADVTAVMGGVKLDLTRAQVAPGTDVVVDIFAMMGGAEIRIPKDWRVDFQTTSVMGGSNDDRVSPRPGARDARRRRGDFEILDVPEPGPVPVPPPPAPPAKAPPPPAIPDLERPDQEQPSPLAPRLVVRGTVVMGVVAVKS